MGRALIKAAARSGANNLFARRSAMIYIGCGGQKRVIAQVRGGSPRSVLSFSRGCIERERIV